MQADPPQRSYNIKNDGNTYYTGHLRNGNQVLMGIQLPEIVLVEFDKGGNYLKTSARTLSWEPEPLDRVMAFDEIELRDCQNELGFTPATIRVKPFFLPERWIGIKDLPEHYQEFLDHPENFDEDERLEYPGQIRLWRENGDFVLYWCEDYYLNQDGDLESS